MIKQSYRILAISPAHFADYVEAETALQQKIMSLSAADIKAMEDDNEEEDDSYILQMVDNVAIINVAGRLTNRDIYWNRYFGMLSYNEIRKAILQGRDNGAGAMVFRYDTPGGAVDGMNETGELIANLDIPTITHTSASMASAGYFLGIQSDYVYADTFADIGSIGVIIKFYDRSKMLADNGIKPVRFRSGKLKAAGDGDFKLTAEETAYIEGIVSNYAGKFYNIVSAARGMPVDYMEKIGITSGRTYIGEEALAVNLIDNLKTFDETMLKGFNLTKRVDKQQSFSLS